MIYKRCRAILADEADAEDATQETFVRVHRYLDRVPEEKEALYWIYRVATNYCLNEIRGRKRRPVPTATDLESHGDVVNGEERFADRDLAARVIAAMHDKVKPVAWLYHVDGFEQDEVARILDLSRRTVATRLALFAENARKFVRRTAA